MRMELFWPDNVLDLLLTLISTDKTTPAPAEPQTQPTQTEKPKVRLGPPEETNPQRLN
jgi:hypothetical protein